MAAYKKFRIIYEIMAITPDGELAAEYFAANRKTAEKIVRDRFSHEDYRVSIRPMLKDEHYWVNPANVERL